MGQYSVRKELNPKIEDGTHPILVNISNVDDSHTRFPRTMHRHDDIMEIIYVKEGHGNHMIGDRYYKVNKGDILVYNKGVLHDEYSNSDSKMSVFCCGITDVQIKGLPRNHLVSKEQSYVVQSGEYAANIESLLEMMYAQIADEKPGAEEICGYLLRSLITLILQIPQDYYVLSKPDESVLLNDIKLYIDEHYQEDISLDLLSQRFHISSYYLVRVFKEFTSFSPIQYIIRRRIGEAQSLLINTNYSIIKISGMVGYDNTSYFTTLFSKTVGMSPNKYRQLWIKN